MICKKTATLAAVLLLICFITAGAEEKFGVKVYEGAKYDAATSKTVSEMMSVNAFCYRTADSIAKVTGFYKKQPGVKSMGETREGALFKKGNIDITIQNPWMDMKSGKMMKETLISIVKNG